MFNIRGLFPTKNKKYGFTSAKTTSHLRLSDIPLTILNDVTRPYRLAGTVVLNDPEIDVNTLLSHRHRRLGNLNGFTTSIVEPRITGIVFKRLFQNMYNVFIDGRYFSCSKTEKEAKEILKFGIKKTEKFISMIHEDMEHGLINGY